MYYLCLQFFVIAIFNSVTQNSVIKIKEFGVKYSRSVRFDSFIFFCKNKESCMAFLSVYLSFYSYVCV